MLLLAQTGLLLTCSKSVALIVKHTSSKTFSGFPNYYVPRQGNSPACSSTEHLPQEALLIWTRARAGVRTALISIWSLVSQLVKATGVQCLTDPAAMVHCGAKTPKNSLSALSANKNWSPSSSQIGGMTDSVFFTYKPRCGIPYTDKLLCNVNCQLYPEVSASFQQ